MILILLIPTIILEWLQSKKNNINHQIHSNTNSNKNNDNDTDIDTDDGSHRNSRYKKTNYNTTDHGDSNTNENDKELIRAIMMLILRMRIILPIITL